MRIVPQREMLEYLDSIGVTPPMSMSGSKSKASGTPAPSNAPKKASQSGCLLLFLIPPLVAASAALVRMLALLLVVVGLLNPSHLLMAQATDPPSAASHSITATTEQEQSLPSKQSGEHDGIMLLEMPPTLTELQQDSHQKSPLDGASTIVDLDVPEIHDAHPSSSVPQITGHQSSSETIRLDETPSGDSESMQPSNDLNKSDDSVDIVPPALRSPTIGGPSRRTTRSHVMRRTWESRGYGDTVIPPWYLDIRFLGMFVGCIAFLMFAYCLYSEWEAIKSQLIGLTRGRSENNNGRHDTRPANMFNRVNPTTKLRSVRIVDSKPNSESSTWRTGVGSIQGNVRSENQDCAAAFEVHGNQVLLIADGCGGVPHGAEASRTAIEACAKSIFWSLISESIDARKVIERGFEAASDALVVKGKELGLGTLEAGLRTTLIVAIGTESEFHWGYIGDGALKVIDSRGKKRECMVAHRSDAAVTNVLSASLGPTLHGTPEFGRMPRNSGDVLLAGTDGVFDRVDDRFTRELMRMAIYHQGNLTQAVLASLHQLASVSDSTGGFVCDDNLSLGMLADGHRPIFQPEFWKAEVLNT